MIHGRQNDVRWYHLRGISRKHQKYFLSMKIPGLSFELPTLFPKYIFCNVATWTVWYDGVILSTVNVHFKFFDIF